MCVWLWSKWSTDEWWKGKSILFVDLKLLGGRWALDVINFHQKCEIQIWQVKHPEFLSCFVTNWDSNTLNCNKKYEIQIWQMNLLHKLNGQSYHATFFKLINCSTYVACFLFFFEFFNFYYFYNSIIILHTREN